MKHRCTPSAPRGLTLLELLLTMVIFSLVIGIFSQALFQISLFSQAATRAGGQWQHGWASGFALDDYFSSLRFQDTPGSQRIEGTSYELTVWWIAQSSSQEGRPVRAQLVLRRMPAARTDLQEKEASWGLYLTDADGSESLRARWPYPVSFRYSNLQGQSYLAWPPASEGPLDVRRETLPRSVSVVDGRDAIAHAWAVRGLTQPGLAPQVEPFMPGGAAAP